MTQEWRRQVWFTGFHSPIWPTCVGPNSCHMQQRDMIHLQVWTKLISQVDGAPAMVIRLSHIRLNIRSDHNCHHGTNLCLCIAKNQPSQSTKRSDILSSLSSLVLSVLGIATCQLFIEFGKQRVIVLITHKNLVVWRHRNLERSSLIRLENPIETPAKRTRSMPSLEYGIIEKKWRIFWK